MKIVKIRKDHKCWNCEHIIKKGEYAEHFKSRQPKFDNIDYESRQIGINYVSLYFHIDYNDCVKNNPELGVELKCDDDLFKN